ncbi:D-tyrosyl-tRNA(Tyr) deacylase [Kineosphaera limosa]|uniref:D-aminoacyl-tRNA deacylase n=1 Tax=Kineosphaera limosa NBRC 100340 TaxID=1184609 RepID=K6W9I4_9MICO|nr:D-aminoacyl-tRNA deacylase [Kineosphaera limosa]NYD99745.1 D-tyrosyl-tRNA(Tyr) deacylase [Kineosphaera limosa]GAB95845.1 D-tyrosyl-tRNA(Tyr) deacylase [Kineosphaera limosa NBRC 100340]
MRAVLARVTRAHVTVDGEQVGAIGAGLLALVAAHRDDGPQQVSAIAAKIAGLRIMRDERSVVDTGGQVLLVSQFTLYGDTRKGRRPSWSAAASGPVAAELLDDLADALRAHGLSVATGRFGAHMAVESVNDGPFTVLVEV